MTVPRLAISEDERALVTTVSSHVRAPRGVDARRRLRALLSALAPLDDEAIDARVERLVAELPDGDAADPAALVEHAQERLERWAEEVLAPGAREADVEGAALRRAFDRCPDALLSDDVAQRAALRAAHAALVGEARLDAQPLRRPRLRWILGLIPSAALGLGGACAFAEAAGGGLVASLWAGLFGILIALHGLSLGLVVIGAWRQRRGPAVERSAGPLPRTALVMPIYEEDPERVFAALEAMRSELLEAPGAEAFEIFVASDTQDPRRAADEVRAWRRLASKAGERVPVFYRRRHDNVGKKAGNLAELLVRHASRYRYVVVLDADSLVGASTLVELVRRMEANPRLGLLQAPIELRGGETLFARALQLGHAIGGPLLTSGLAGWSGPDGNYFGHNAIVRTEAFVRCCGLPTLSGAPPLGGTILSHDFVEAALLRRGGWEVRIADDLGESYEEPPPTLRDFLVRDRRWCQGNLQHLRLVLAHGLAARSRLHLLLGAVAYLVSPLWLVFLILGAVHAMTGEIASPRTLLALAVAALGLLLAPRLVGLAHALARARAFGGAARLLLGALLELVVSLVLAPLMMLAHTTFVLEVATGAAVGWGPQRRVAEGAFAAAVDARSLLATALGVTATLVTSVLAPSALPYVLPIALPWALAIPIAAALGSEAAGRALARAGILGTPVENAPPPVVRALDARRGYYHADHASRFRDLVLDPVLCARVCADAEREEAPVDDELVARAVEVGPAGLDVVERDALLGSSRALRALHRAAWRRWCVEEWELPRGVRSEPRTEELVAP